MKNETAARTQAVSPLKRFNSAITSPKLQEYITQVLGEKKQSFVNNITALVGANTLLQNCEPMSVVYAALKATALNLPFDPSLGLAYVIPYNSKTGAVAQFQLGYAGLRQLALRSGAIETLNAAALYEGDVIKEDILTGKFTIIPNEAADRKKKPIIGFFAYLKTKESAGGFEKIIYMTKEEMDDHGRRFSKSFLSGPWQTDYLAMGKKTVLKKVLDWAPLSIEAQVAIKYDQSVIHEPDGEPDYVDNYTPDEQLNQATEEQERQVKGQKEEMRESGKAPIDMP